MSNVSVFPTPAPERERPAEGAASHLIAPHGGELVDLMATPERAAELKAASRDWSSWDLTPRQFCDLELLLNGGFSPLRGFMDRADHDAVCAGMRLADGTLWPIPIVLDVTPQLASTLKTGGMLALRDPEGVMLAALHVEEIWEPDLPASAQSTFGTTSTDHPGVAHLLHKTHPVALAGRLEGLQMPIHYDFRSLRRTPAELRAEFAREGWRRVVAFQTRNPMHRAHCELSLRAAKEVRANLLIHPTVGMTKPGDIDHYTRVRCYQAVLPRMPQHTAKLSLLPLAMRMAGPREALLHALIRKNYGCTHFIVGRDHASPGSDRAGKPFYGPYDAQELMQQHQEELGVEMVPFKMVSYVEELDTYMPADEVPAGARTLDISGTELRRRLQEGRDLPTWFTFPEVADELRRTHPPRKQQGFTVFLTGLSGAGKSTIASALLVRRIGFVASEITKNGGIAICAPIAPYDSVRKEVRSLIEPGGGFVLVFIATPIEVCEDRDRKGLYAKARAGILKEFTGISDPYEEPVDADLVLDTTKLSPEESAQEILLFLEREGYVGGNLESH
jgi:sulfate adenylyltransferase